jgi:hypothetical protein
MDPAASTPFGGSSRGVGFGIGFKALPKGL